MSIDIEGESKWTRSLNSAAGSAARVAAVELQIREVLRACRSLLQQIGVEYTEDTPDFDQQYDKSVRRILDVSHPVAITAPTSPNPLALPTGFVRVVQDRHLVAEDDPPDERLAHYPLIEGELPERLLWGAVDFLHFADNTTRPEIGTSRIGGMNFISTPKHIIGRYCVQLEQITEQQNLHLPSNILMDGEVWDRRI